MAHTISALTHVTKSIHLANIFRVSLDPGGVDPKYDEGSKRNASNFNAFLPDDERNVVVGRDSAEYDAVIVLKIAELLADFKMTISHNGIIACEQWLLYNSNIIGSPIHGVGVPTGDVKDATYGQVQAARLMPATYEDNAARWPCLTRFCLNVSCGARMPAGYTVCTACHCPFVFEEPQAGKPRRINVPAMAAQVVMPGSLALDNGTPAQKQYSAN
eukprot:2570744-Heterocapsa_arctica.AAC.1